MTDSKRENGVYVPKHRPPPTETDQNAGMPKNPHGHGLSQSSDETNDETHQSDQAGSMTTSTEKDAKGQYAQTQHGGHNNGVSSAEPEVISGTKSGDATFKHTYNGIDNE